MLILTLSYLSLIILIVLHSLERKMSWSDFVIWTECGGASQVMIHRELRQRSFARCWFRSMLQQTLSWSKKSEFFVAASSQVKSFPSFSFFQLWGLFWHFGFKEEGEAEKDQELEVNFFSAFVWFEAAFGFKKSGATRNDGFHAPEVPPWAVTCIGTLQIVAVTFREVSG